MCAAAVPDDYLSLGAYRSDVCTLCQPAPGPSSLGFLDEFWTFEYLKMDITARFVRGFSVDVRRQIVFLRNPHCGRNRRNHVWTLMFLLIAVNCCPLLPRSQGSIVLAPPRAVSRINVNTNLKTRGWVFLPREATRSAVLPWHVVRPSVCPSVCDVEVSWSYRFEFLENNFTAD